MQAITQLLSTQFWSNFKGRILGTSRKDSNGHGGIGLDNISPFFEQQTLPDLKHNYHNPDLTYFIHLKEK